MYLPAMIFVGPLPLFSVLMILGILVTSFVLSRYRAPERVQDLLWAVIVGAVLGEKGLYIVTGFHYYLAHPTHLLFTPQSSLGTWGLGIGAGTGAIIVLIHARSQWRRTDWDYVSLALSPGLALSSLGFNWLGMASRIPVFSISYHHLNRFATFFLFFLLMSAISLLLFLFYRSHRYAPGQLAGIFALLTAIALVIAQMTAVRYQFRLQGLDWMAMVLAMTGYLLMGRTPNR